MWPLKVDEVVQDGDISVKCSRIIKRKTRVTMYNLIVMQHLLDNKGNKLGLYRSADVSFICYHDYILEVANSPMDLQNYIYIIRYLAYLYVLSPGQRALIFEG